MENVKTIRQDCGNGIALVMEDYSWLGDNGVTNHEFVTYIEKDGVVWQDLTCVRLNVKEDTLPKAEVLIWANPGFEDYTDRFVIDMYEEE